MPNIHRDCIDCGNPFYITEKDQIWFAQKIVPCSGCATVVNGVSTGTGFQVNDDGAKVPCFICEGKGATPMETPRRCYHCRQQRRTQTQETNAWADAQLPLPVPTRTPSRSPVRPIERANDKRGKVR